MKFKKVDQCLQLKIEVLNLYVILGFLKHFHSPFSHFIGTPVSMESILDEHTIPRRYQKPQILGTYFKHVQKCFKKTQNLAPLSHSTVLLVHCQGSRQSLQLLPDHTETLVSIQLSSRMHPPKRPHGIPKVNFSINSAVCYGLAGNRICP